MTEVLYGPKVGSTNYFCTKKKCFSNNYSSPFPLLKFFARRSNELYFAVHFVDWMYIDIRVILRNLVLEIEKKWLILH